MPNLLPNTLDVNIVRLYKALFDQAPGYTLLNAYNDLGTVQAVSTQLNAQFASLSNAQWASLIAGNLHLTGQAFTVARDFLIIQQNSVPAAQVIAHRAAMLPGLLLGYSDNFESDGLFGADARYFNNSVLASYQYSINPANTSVDPAILALADEPNTPPVAVNDTGAATEGGAAIGGTVAANDTDAQGDALSFALAATQAPVPGLVFNANGTYTFDPTNAAYESIRAGQARDVVVNYRVTDTEGGFANGTLTITVTGTNDGPVAQAVAGSGQEDAASIAVTPMSADVDSGDSATYTVVGQPFNGTVSFNTATGNFDYVPRANFAGNDSFTYRVTDGSGATSTATASVTVNAVNDAPTANASSAAGVEDTPLGGTVTGGDIEGSALTFAVTAQPINGTVALSTNGAYVYTPAANFNGTDSFKFTSSDGLATSAEQTVTITVTPANDAPVALAVAAAADEGSTGVEVTPMSTDIDTGDTATYAVETGPGQGTVTYDATTKKFTYVPPSENFNGVVTFTYRATDAGGLSSVGTATVTIRPVNDAPVAQNLTVSGNESTEIRASVSASDIDGDTLRFTVASQPANGTITLDANSGEFVYISKPGFVGADTFTYTASDASGGSDTKTVTVNVLDLPNILTVGNDVVKLFGTAAQTVIGNEETYNSGDVIVGSDSTRDKLQLQLDPSDDGVTTLSSASVTGIELFQISSNPNDPNDSTIDLLMTNVSTDVDEIHIVKSTAEDIRVRDIQAAPGALPLFIIDDVGAVVTIDVDGQNVLAGTDQLNMEIEEFGNSSTSAFGRANLNVDVDVEVLQITDMATAPAFASDIDQISGGFHTVNVLGGSTGTPLTIQGPGEESGSETGGFSSSGVSSARMRVDSTAFLGNLVADIDAAADGEGAPVTFTLDGNSVTVTPGVFTGVGNDQLSAHDDVFGVIDSGAGNDAIMLSNEFSGEDTDLVGGTIRSGTGNDTVNVQSDVVSDGSTGSSIDLGEGSDVGVVGGTLAAGSSMSGMAGADTLVVDGGVGGTLDGGDDNDSISVAGGVLRTASTLGAVMGGAGNDSITVSGTILGAVSGGAGDDSITTAGTLGDGANISLPAALGSIDGGDGNDTMSHTGTVSEGAVISGGAGDDTMTVAGDINGNAVDGLTPAVNDFQAAAQVNGGDGNDSLTLVSGLFNGKVNMGAGNDAVTINAAVGDGTGAVDLGAGDDSITLKNRSWTAADTDGALGNDDAIMGGDGTDGMTIDSVSTPATTRAGVVTVTYTYAANGTMRVSFNDDLAATQPAAKVVSVPAGSSLSSTVDALVTALNGDAAVAAIWTASKSSSNQLVLTSTAFGSTDPSLRVTAAESLDSSGAQVSNSFVANLAGNNAGPVGPWSVTSDGTGTDVTADADDGTDITSVEALNLSTKDGFDGDENGGVSGTQDNEFDHTFNIALEAYDSALAAINVLERDDSATVNLSGYASEQINIDSDGDQEGDGDDADVVLNVNDTQGTGARALNVALNGSSAYSVDINDDNRINTTNLAVNGTGARTVTLDGEDQDNNGATAGEGNSLIITGNSTSALTVTGIYQETVNGSAYAGNQLLTIADDDDGGNETLSVTTGSGNDVINMVADMLNFSIDTATGVVTGDSINGGAGTDRLIIDSSTPTAGNSVDQDFVFKRITSIEELEARGDAGGTLSLSIENDARETGVRTVIISNNGGTRGNADLDFESDFTTGSNGPAVTVNVQSSNVTIDNGASVHMQLNIDAAKASAGGAASGAQVDFNGGSGTGAGTVNVNVNVAGGVTTNVGGVSSSVGQMVNTGTGAAQVVMPTTAGHVNLITTTGTIDSFKLTDGGTDQRANVTWNDGWAQGVTGFVVDLALANDDDTTGDADLATGGVNFVGAQENDTSFVITGSANSDTLWGSQMGDTISGGAGNDLINADPNGAVVTPGVQMVKTLEFDNTQIIEAGDRVSVMVGGRTYTWTAPSGEDTPDGQQLGNTSALAELVAAINASGDNGEDDVTETGSVDDATDGDDVMAELLGDVIRVTGTGVDPTFGYPLGENHTVDTGLTATLMNRPTAIVDLEDVGSLDVGDVVRISINGTNHNATVRADIDAGTAGNQPETEASLAAQLVASVNGGSNMTAVQDGTQVVLRGNAPSTAYTLSALWSTDQLTTPASAKTVTVTYSAPAGGDSVSVTFGGGITVSNATVAGLVAAINGNGTLSPQWTASAAGNTLTITGDATGPFAGANDFVSAAFNGSGTATFSSVNGQNQVTRTDNTDPTVAARTATFTFEDGSYDAGDVVSVTINGVTTNVTLDLGGEDDAGNDVNLTGAQVAAQVSAEVSASGVSDTVSGNEVTFDAGAGGLATFLVTLEDIEQTGPSGLTAGDIAEVRTLDYSAVLGGATGFSATINGVTKSAATLGDLVTAINADGSISGANGYDASLAADVITLTGPANGTEPFGTVEPNDAAVSGAATSDGGSVGRVTVAAVAAVRRVVDVEYTGSIGGEDGADITIEGTSYSVSSAGTVAGTLTALAAAVNANSATHGWAASPNAGDLRLTGPVDGSDPESTTGTISAANIRDESGTGTSGAITAPDTTNGEVITGTLALSSGTPSSISVTFDTNDSGDVNVTDTTLTGTTTATLAALINSTTGIGAGFGGSWTAAAVSPTVITITGPSSGLGGTSDPILLTFAGATGSATVVETSVADPTSNTWEQDYTVTGLNAGDTVVVRYSNGTSSSVPFNTDAATTLTDIGNAIDTALFAGAGAVSDPAGADNVRLNGPNDTTTPTISVSSIFVYQTVAVTLPPTEIIAGAPAVPATETLDFTNWDAANEMATVTFANGESFTVPFAGTIGTSLVALETAIEADDLDDGDVNGASSWSVSFVGSTLVLTGPASGVAPLIGFSAATIVASNNATMTELFESWDNTDNGNPTIRVTSGLANFVPDDDVTTGAVAAGVANGSGNDSVLGGDGNDTINGYGGADSLSGDAGNDVLSGGDGPDILSAGEGNDAATGGSGDDNLTGAGGNDSLDGGDNADVIDGGSGLDRLIGGAGNDIITGGDDGDFIRGGTGRDVVTGGSGNDTFYFFADNGGSESQGSIGLSDAITDFASGSDTLQFNFGVTFYANVANATDLLAGLADVSTSRLGRAIYDTNAKILYVDRNGDGQLNDLGGDVVIDLTQSGTASLAQANFSTLIDGATTGTAGNDLLIGTAGADVMDGLGGNDTMFGGTGADTLTGGSGADVFHFASSGDGVNRITDFATGTDKLQFTSTTVALAGSGTALGTALSTSPAAGKAFFVTSGTPTLHIDTDGNGTADITLELVGVTTLAQGDFLAPAAAPLGS